MILLDELTTCLIDPKSNWSKRAGLTRLLRFLHFSGTNVGYINLYRSYKCSGSLGSKLFKPI